MLVVQGALYGSRSSADAPSTLVWRPFDAWAANSDWSLGLPAGEEACCVAAGRSFCAAATSARLLRLFAPSGQYFMLSSCQSSTDRPHLP